LYQEGEKMKRDSIFFLILTASFVLIWHPLQLLDYSAFFCAGHAVRSGVDPYDQVGLLGACQQHVVALTGARLVRGEVLPAPFPPYALALFGTLSFLPLPVGAVMWILLLLASYVALVCMLQRMTSFRPVLIVTVTGIPVLWASLEVAEITSIIVTLIVACAAALRAERYRLAGVCAVLVLCEPHLGLPLCLALFCSQPKTRLTLLAGGVLFAAIAYLAMPPALSWHYITQVLSHHAQAEMLADAQLSLAHALAVLGVPLKLAGMLGAVQYLMMVVLGTFLAIRLSRDPQQRDLAILAAPTLAVFGGSFVHVHQIAIASCCALLLLRKYLKEKKPTYWLDASLCLFATPLILARSPQQMFAYMTVVLLFALIRDYHIRIAGIAAIGTCGVMNIVYSLMSSRLWLLTPIRDANFIPHYNYGPNADIETVWHAFIAARYSWLGPVSLVAQAPTFLALTIVCFALVQRVSVQMQSSHNSAHS